MKKFVQYLADNKNVLLKRGLIVAATIGGLALTAGLVTKINHDEDLVIDDSPAV